MFLKVNCKKMLTSSPSLPLKTGAFFVSEHLSSFWLRLFYPKTNRNWLNLAKHIKCLLFSSQLQSNLFTYEQWPLSGPLNWNRLRQVCGSFFRDWLFYELRLGLENGRRFNTELFECLTVHDIFVRFKKPIQRLLKNVALLSKLFTIVKK